ncbi:MAG: TMEM165/GDT1 family protein [Acidobacteria bacterium]|nr:TMEM165/GDT1 family protein [Acidobacteriota bacterium]
MPTPEDLQALTAAFTIVFIAELGDKTQLLIVAFAAKIGFARTAITLVLGSILVSGVSAFLGGALQDVLPQRTIQIAAAVLLIGFGLFLLFRGSEEEEEEVKEVRAAGWFRPVAAATTVFVLAEIADKTMLATLALAAGTGRPLPVWAGASAGLIAANVIAIALVGAFIARISDRMRDVGVAVIFIVSGVILLLWS